MSLTSYPAARPLQDQNGAVIFPVTHVNYVIDAVSKSNPVLNGPLKIGNTVVIPYDPATGKVGPIPAAIGGTGNTSTGGTANDIKQELGFTAAGILPINKGGTGATTAAAALAALGGASVVRYSVNVPTSWSAYSSGGYTKAVTVNGITANDCPIVGVVLSSDTATAKTQLQAAGCVNRVVTSANTITLYAYNSAPTTAFTIQLLCVRGF